MCHPPPGQTVRARPPARRAEHDSCSHSGDDDEKQHDEQPSLSRSPLCLGDQLVEPSGIRETGASIKLV